MLKNNWSAQDISLNLSKLQFASPISVSAAPRRFNHDPIQSSIIKVSTGNVKLSVERSNSKVDPTEIVISRVISARNKKDNKLLSNSFVEQKDRRTFLATGLKRLSKTNRVVQGHAIAVRDSSTKGKEPTNFI